MQQGFIQILSQQTRGLWERVSAGVALAWALGRLLRGATQAGPERGKTNGLNLQQNCCASAKQPAKGSAGLVTHFFQSCAALLKSFYWPRAQRNQSAASLPPASELYATKPSISLADC